MKNSYEINEGTLAIVPNKENSKIYEDNDIYSVKQNCYQIMCKYFGSSYEGRSDGAKSISGMSYKVPIMVSENLIFFPTSSPLDDDCSWINFEKVEDLEKMNYNQTKIIFNNGVNIVVPFSYRTIENQLLRSIKLNFIMNKRYGEK